MFTMGVGQYLRPSAACFGEKKKLQKEPNQPTTQTNTQKNLNKNPNKIPPNRKAQKFQTSFH